MVDPGLATPAGTSGSMNSPVDIWTVYHAVGWCVATYITLVATFGKKLVLEMPRRFCGCGFGFYSVEVTIPSWQVVAGLAMVCGFGWEICEYIWVEPALGFKEPWFNRWVSDPGADALGILGALYLRARVIIAKATK